ncbi:MAG: squalene synthase HpnC [Bacteroidota bacterium]
MTTREAYRYCERIARGHYENFPVASLLLPPAMRPHVAALYAFARHADDCADEGDLPPGERLAALGEWGEMLAACFRGEARHPVFIALGETIRTRGLPHKPLEDLLTAFRMDVTRNRYETFEDLLEYCRHSADPVGRLVLALAGAATERLVGLSDSVCTALQLANFWQDAGADRGRGRLYVPLADCRRFGYTEADFASRLVNKSFRDLMRFQVERTRGLFQAGRPLCREAPGCLRREVTLTWLGGMAVLGKIESIGYDVLTRRPALGLGEKAGLLVRMLAGRTP